MQDTRTIENLKEIISRYNDSLIEEKKELFTPKKIIKEINDSRKKMKEVVKEPLNIKKVLEDSLSKIRVIKNTRDDISFKEINDSLVVLSCLRKEIEELQIRSAFLKNILKYVSVIGITFLSVYISYSYYF